MCRCASKFVVQVEVWGFQSGLDKVELVCWSGKECAFRRGCRREQRRYRRADEDKDNKPNWSRLAPNLETGNDKCRRRDGESVEAAEQKLAVSLGEINLIMADERSEAG